MVKILKLNKTTSPLTEPRPSIMKKRILIIDDDKLLNKINEKVLHAAGLVKELHIVVNGIQAIDYLTARIEKNYPLPEIIILDLHMPVMGGFDFIDRFKEMEFPGKSNIQIVVFTSSSSPRDRQKARDRGIEHFVNKPYLLRSLTDIVMRSRIPEF
jgi:CheY-like chemotaxis protein